MINGNTRFTPGPWHTRGGMIFHDGAAGAIGLKLGSPWREEAWCDDDADEETLANAHLIAAAPSLYAALEEYMACVALTTRPEMQSADVITLHEVAQRLDAARKAAEAALALARSDQGIVL